MPVAARSIANLRKGGGRAGMPNKVQYSIKEMVEHALHKAGGIEYLTQQAHANPVAFMGLVGRVLPLQLNTNSNSPGSLHLIAATASGIELLKLTAEGEPPTNGHAVTIETTAVDLDAPPPEE